MKDWDLLNNNVSMYLKNCNILNNKPSVLMNTKTLYREGFAVGMKRSLGQYSKSAQMELYERLTNKDISGATIKIVDSEFESLIEQLTKIIDAYDLRNTPIKEKSYPTSYFSLIQPIFELKEWYESTKDSLRNSKGGIILDEVDIVPSIFHDKNTYELFLYLVDRYENDKPKSKFSHLFHFIKEIQGDYSILNIEYIKFVKKEYGVSISKIQPKNSKYFDSNKGRLTLLRSKFLNQE